MPRNTVALGVRGPTLAEGGGGINPLMPIQALEGISRVQNMQNQNRLFQMEMAGRQRFGEILSQNSDEQAAFAQAMQDPVAAPYAMTQIQGYRASLLAQRQINESIGKDVHTGLEAIMKAAPQAAFDPQGYQNTLNAYYMAIPKDAREAARVPFQYIQTSMFGGLDNMTPQQQNAEISKRAMGLGIGSGAMTPDSVRNIMGLPAPGVDTFTGSGGESIPVVRNVPLAGPGAGQVNFSRIPMPGEGPVPGPTAPTTPGGANALAPPTAGTLVTPPGSPLAPPVPTPVATSAAAAPGQSMHGPTLEQQKITEQGAQQVGRMYEDIGNDSKAIPVVASRLNALQDALKDFPAGGWASSRGNIATWIQGFGHAMGVDPTTVDKWTQDITGGKMEAQQVFHAMVNQYAIDQLKQVAQGTGRVMQAEVMSFLNAISENTDPRAIEKMLNTQGRQILQISADRVNKFAPFMRDSEAGKIEGFRPQDFYNWYGSKSLDIGKLPSSYGGIDISPRDIAEAKGVPGRKVYYQPGSGTVGLAPPGPVRPSPASPTPVPGGTTIGPDIQ